jgi:hypothetical protein
MLTKPTIIDPGETVKRLDAKMAEHEQPLPADVEQAWQTWSASIQRVDERGWALLRAAFEAGVEAGRQGSLKSSG